MMKSGRKRKRGRPKLDDHLVCNKFVGTKFSSEGYMRLYNLSVQMNKSESEVIKIAVDRLFDDYYMQY